MGKREAKKIARQYLRRLELKRIPIQKAFLFGSYVMGKATDNSDIDIGIFSDAFTDASLEDQVKMRKERWEIDLRIEPHFFSSGALKDSSNSLVYEIKEKGEEISI